MGELSTKFCGQREAEEGAWQRRGADKIHKIHVLSFCILWDQKRAEIQQKCGPEGNGKSLTCNSAFRIIFAYVPKKISGRNSVYADRSQSEPVG